MKCSKPFLEVLRYLPDESRVDEKVYLPNNNVRRKGAKISF